MFFGPIRSLHHQIDARNSVQRRVRHERSQPGGKMYRCLRAVLLMTLSTVTRGDLQSPQFCFLWVCCFFFSCTFICPSLYEKKKIPGKGTKTLLVAQNSKVSKAHGCLGNMGDCGAYFSSACTCRTKSKAKKKKKNLFFLNQFQS